MGKLFKRRRDGKRLIESVTHGPFSADIRMDDAGVFHCEYGAESFQGSLPEARVFARNTLRKICSLKWQPVMEVFIDSEDTRVNNLRNCSNLCCRIERKWIAWTGKKWIECPWVVDPPGVTMCSGPADSEREQDAMPVEDLMAQRLARSRAFWDGPDREDFTWPIVRESHGECIYYVEYTEANWHTMLGIQDKLRELRTGINRLLTTTKGWKTLAKIAENKLLPETT